MPHCEHAYCEINGQHTTETPPQLCMQSEPFLGRGNCLPEADGMIGVCTLIAAVDGQVVVIVVTPVGDYYIYVDYVGDKEA